MTIKERIINANSFCHAKEYDTAHKLYCEIRRDSPSNKRALYCQAVNLYNMSYDSDGGNEWALTSCLSCCKLYIKDEPKERHMKVKNLALMAYEMLLNIKTGIWIEV